MQLHAAQVARHTPIHQYLVWRDAENFAPPGRRASGALYMSRRRQERPVRFHHALSDEVEVSLALCQS